ncbi:hypothetical protein QUF74_08655 [Candidatus Halobeggiatoa sp. HSG11]|nr:hypothetical protein [Candidatus Halobeggiatoa sp. HSG11]
MKKILLIIVFILIKPAYATTSIEEPHTVEIGNIGGEYADLVIEAIDNNLQKYGYIAISKPAKNHQENIDKLKAGTISSAFIPLDIAAFNLTAENDPEENLLLIGGKVAPKVFFCVAYKGSNIKSYSDLINNDSSLKISVGNKNSITARTFHNLAELEPKLQNFKLYYESTTKIELNRLLSGRRDLVCFTSIPDPDNELINMVSGHGELSFITIEQPSFAESKIGKIRIYDILEIPVTNGFLGFNQEKVKTLVTWLSVVVNEKQMDQKLLNSLTSVVMKPDLFLSHSFAYKTKKLFNMAVTQIKEMVK